jgi:hypothetical protein
MFVAWSLAVGSESPSQEGFAEKRSRVATVK